MPAYQLPLQIKLDDAATFANFHSAGNEELVALLQRDTEPYIYFWAGEAAGKTHLLQAICKTADRRAIYLPMQEISQLSPEIFEGLEQFELVCIDDLQVIAGQKVWEQALFNLFNRIRETNTRLRIAGSASINRLGIKLPDLASRLNWGPVFHLQALSDLLKIEALKLRAGLRGFELPDEVASYMLNHCPRDMHHLFALLDKLEEATLQAKRKLSVPFVKQYL